jgi:hypothetical protein
MFYRVLIWVILQGKGVNAQYDKYNYHNFDHLSLTDIITQLLPTEQSGGSQYLIFKPPKIPTTYIFTC